MKGVYKIDRGTTEYWYARVDGQRVYCGKGVNGKKIAQAARAKFMTMQYEERERAAGLVVKRDRLKTVKDLLDWYMLLPKTQNQKSYPRKVSLAAHLKDHLGRKSVSQVEGDEQEEYIELRKRAGAASRTANLELCLLSAAYHLAVKRRKIHTDSMPKEFVRDEVLADPRPLVTDEQYKGLLEHAAPDFYDVLLCGYESAMRLGEVLKLTKQQVHLGETIISGGKQAKVWYLDLGVFETKTKTRRMVPVSAELEAVLVRRLEGLDPNDHVFVNEEGRPYQNSDINYRLKQSCTKAGIPHGDKTRNQRGERIGLVYHSLRHTRITRWVEDGWSDEIIRRATGHASLEAYRNYVKITDAGPIMRLVERHTNDIRTVMNQ